MGIKIVGKYVVEGLDANRILKQMLLGFLVLCPLSRLCFMLWRPSVSFPLVFLHTCVMTLG